MAVIFELVKDTNFLSLALKKENQYEYFLDANVGETIKEPQEKMIVEYGINEDEVADPRGVDDYPCLSATIPVFSERFVQEFGAMLNSSGQLFPLYGEDKLFYFFNCTNLEDLVDEENSEFEYSDGFLISINKLVLTRCPNNSHIFKLSKDPRGPIYVDEIFKEKIEKSGFFGFNFKAITTEE